MIYRYFNCSRWILFIFLVCTCLYSVTIARETESCGAGVLKYLQQNFFQDKQAPRFSSSNTYSMSDLLVHCRTLMPSANAIMISDKKLTKVPSPAILHFSAGHYIVLTGQTEDICRFWDPTVCKIDSIDKDHLCKMWSGYAIIFAENVPLIAQKQLDNIAGFYMHETRVPPPNKNRGRRGPPPPPPPDKGKKDKTDPQNDNDKEQGQCANNRTGKTACPLLYLNPVGLNISALDIPMWYQSGVGPSIVFQVLYNGNDKQAMTGGLTAPTQYFPLGKYWSFAYGCFYHTNSSDTVTFILPSGSLESYVPVSGGMKCTDSYSKNHVERYTVSGGYGYKFTYKINRVSYIFDDPIHKKLTAIEDQNGNRVILTYNTDYNLVSITDAVGRTSNLNLDDHGRILQITDPLGRHTVFQYGHTDNDYLVSITDMGGYTSTMQYGMIEILQATTPLPGYDTRLTSISTPNGTSSISYDVTDTNAPGHIGYIINITNPNGVTAKTTYMWLGNDLGITTMEDNNHNKYEYYISIENNRIEKVVYPDPEASIYYRYNTKGYRDRITKGTFSTTWTFDDRGNVLTETNPRNLTTVMTYDADDNLLTLTDPMNHTTSYAYDSHGNMTSITTPVTSSSFTYLTNGNLNTATNGNSKTTNLFYDANGYLSQINYPLGKQSMYTNDVVGRVLSRSENGRNFGYSYDGLDNVTRITYPDGLSSSFSYFLGSLTDFTDRGGRYTHYTYDGMVQVSQVTGPEGVLRYYRDGNGNILAMNVNGQSTVFEYDVLKRMTSMTNPDGTTKTYAYDALGNVVSRRDENGVYTDYEYNYNLLTRIDYGDATPDISFQYNNNGQMTYMSDAAGITTFSYDNGGRLIAKNGPLADDELVYTYDNAGNRLSMTMPGFSTSYTYDDLNRLTYLNSTYASAQYAYDPTYHYLKRMTYGNGSYAEYDRDVLLRLTSLANRKSDGSIISSFNYQYDNGSMITRITDEEGNRQKYDYDQAYHLIEEDVIDASGKTLWHNQFNYDPMGNRIRLIKNGITDRYDYNNNNQLTELVETLIKVSGTVSGDSTTAVYVQNIKANTKYLGSHQLAFEAENIPIENGQDSLKIGIRVNTSLAIANEDTFNVRTVSAPYKNVNIYLLSDTTGLREQNLRMIEIVRQASKFEYDNNGNLTKKIIGDSITTYQYNTENQLIRIDFPDGSNESYVYDSFGQRIKILKSGSVFESFIYDGSFVAAAVRLKDGSHHYLTQGLNLGGGIGGLIAKSGISIPQQYFFYNHRGDVNSIIQNHIIVFKSFCSAFDGISRDYERQDLSYIMNTKAFEKNSRLYYYGKRYYSNHTGRFINKDPLSFQSGTNLYVFCNNNPLNYYDPLGLTYTNLCLLERYREEYEKIKEIYQQELDKWKGFNDLGDAWRHAEASKRITQEIDPLTAFKAGLANEFPHTQYQITSLWQDLRFFGSFGFGFNAMQEGTFMDIFNNIQGIKAGLENRPIDQNSLITR